MTDGLGRVLSMGETFRSKSGGRLHVMFQLNERAFEVFFGPSKSLRVYRVTDIPKGGVGAREFHKLRSELVTVEKGSFKLLLEDVKGKRKCVKLREKMTYGIIRPLVLHTYVALTESACLHVVANTLYDHKKTATHDTYSESEFRKLQRTFWTR